MGNKWISACAKRDFVLELPPEVCVVVLSFLRLSEVLTCLLVCRRWRDTILKLSLYWTNQIQKLGMRAPKGSLLPPLASYKDFYLAAKRYRFEVEALEVECVQPACFPCVAWPADSHYRDSLPRLVSQLQVMVWREGSCLRAEEVLCVGEVVYTKKLASVKLSCGDLPLEWVHFSGHNGGRLHWHHRSSVGGGMEVWSSPGRLQGIRSGTERRGGGGGGGGDQVQRVVVPLQEEEEEGDGRGVMEGEVVFGGCEKCCLGVLVWRKLRPHAASTELCLQAVKLGVIPLQMASLRNTHYHNTTTTTTTTTCAATAAAESRGGGGGGGGGGAAVQLRVRGSGDASPATGGVCNHHCVLLQEQLSATALVAFTELVDTSSAGKEAAEARKAVLPFQMRMWSECVLCCKGDVASLDSVFVPSVCNWSCFGQVCGKTLCVWQVREDKDSLELVSRADITGQSHEREEEEEEEGEEGGCKLELMVLGKHLSIIQCIKKNSVTSIDILLTLSGTILKRILVPVLRSGDRLLTSSPSSPTHYLLSREAQKWLCGVTAPCPDLLLTIAYPSETHNHLQFVLVKQVHTRQTQQQQQQQQQHWVQAINYGFSNVL